MRAPTAAELSRHAPSGKRSQRMRDILALLAVDDVVVSIDELTERLQVSAPTIRRDLADLDDLGLVLRTHGGARAIEARDEVPVRFRDTQFREAKRRIAMRVAEMIPAGPYAIALSGGTTTAAVAKELSNRSELTIVTNSLTTATEIASRPNLQVIMTGGLVRSTSFEAVGALAENTFSAINVGTAILGTDGISAQGGATTHDEREARTNLAMVRHAQRVIVVADGSKVGRVTLARMAELGQIHDLVTDSSADPDELERLAAADIAVHVVAL
ncbi:alkaline phosphatase [Plantibacter flavus]|uniref:DeoR/GlpR family DNA-binding transcription regulator n=1 Tax=Plantibacter flavus TaxID=150123 RepID=UPI00099C5E97|nr:DeoR/GlpR family DNA-binding transcription regulator [Plantibacter flavus]AQX81395.1 alkaline phosphatase [Plantibacter flavus]